MVGAVTQVGVQFRARAVVLTAGTFLDGKIHVGLNNYTGGRAGDPAVLDYLRWEGDFVLDVTLEVLVSSAAMRANSPRGLPMLAASIRRRARGWEGLLLAILVIVVAYSSVQTPGFLTVQNQVNLLHLGIGYRHTGATDGKLSYKAKPEVNTAPTFISSGSFAASGAGTLMLEGIYVKEAVTLISEWMSTKVNAPSVGDPRFSYWQMGGSWFLTGENRRYNKQNGNLGKLIPRKNFRFRKGSGPGAIELASRFTHTDGTDAGIAGGTFNRLTFAASWYVNTHFRYEINYGRGWLMKNDITGNVNIWQFRAQFEL